MAFAMRSASCNAASRVGKTLETNPKPRASSDEKSRAVSASSRTAESLPTIFGKRASVPTSAARPTAASLMQKKASLLQRRTSTAVSRSTPAPMQAPCTTAIVGFKQDSIAERPACIGFTCAMNFNPLLAGSSAGGGWFSGSARSRPAEKHLPRAESTMARHSPSAASASNTRWHSPQNRQLRALRLAGRFISTWCTPSAKRLTASVSSCNSMRRAAPLQRAEGKDPCSRAALGALAELNGACLGRQP
mmetsp:Transcript_3507/g.11216  ORF Transcript_3507/g.11216 Transcript_3507/m.11216 type:complete len:248 (+) Transcript_3507:501-1244(+)